jgi:hypothetical protein
MSYYYISNPYNGSEEQREERAKIAAYVCGRLLKKGIHAWSPIVHNHAMMKTFNEFTLEERRTMILDFDFSLLKASKAMIVLTIDGWQTSYGVTAEIELCRELSIPIKYLNPKELMSDCDPLLLLKDNPAEA